MTAPGLSTANANAALSTIISSWLWEQLHTADPGTAGTTAVSSVTTREAVTWGSPSGGTVSANGTLPTWASWAGTNGEVVSHTSGWSLATSGTFEGSIALSASVTMDTGDELELTTISVTIPTAS